MSGVSPAPKKGRHRHSKSGSFVASPAPAKKQDQHQHQQVHHQLPHSIPQFNQPVVPRSPALASPPHTPRGNQKRRGRKNRPKDVETSHYPMILEDSAQGHEGAVQIPFEQPLETPRKAYAGPTFHSSPAPNELPVPKFLSKMHPSGLQSDLSDIADMGLTSESSSQSDSPPTTDGSPLDILFRADRAERDRSHSRLKSNVSARATEYGSPKSRHAHIYAVSNSPPQKPSTHDLMFSMDQEGEFSNLTNRSHSPIVKRGSKTASSPFAAWNRNNTPVGVDVFGAPVNSDIFGQSPFSTSNFHAGIENTMPSSPLFGPRAGARSAHSIAESSESADIRRMESDLRRILKLEPSLSVPQTVVN